LLGIGKEEDWGVGGAYDAARAWRGTLNKVFVTIDERGSPMGSYKEENWGEISRRGFQREGEKKYRQLGEKRASIGGPKMFFSNTASGNVWW